MKFNSICNMPYTNDTKPASTFSNDTKPTSTANSFLLLESGFYLLLETGDKIILTVATGGYSQDTKPTSSYSNDTKP